MNQDLKQVCNVSNFLKRAEMSHSILRLAFSFLAAVALLLSSGTPVTTAQSSSYQFFPETGHTVSGDFLNFFNAHGGLRTLGYPITDPFDWNGMRVQYFQRARMELHPENPYSYRVQLGLLGDELGYREPPVAPVASDPYRRYFPETGHTVAYAFLNFFDQYGIDVFGYPITEFKNENGRIVQYFQRARMEWHPELSGDQRVQLGELGTIHFDKFGFSQDLKGANLTPAIALGTAQPPLILRVKVSVKLPITKPLGEQVLFVYVTDQTGRPVVNAAVSFTVRSAEGMRSFDMPRTDANGFTTLKFNVGNVTPGQIQIIEVKAGYLDRTGGAQASFLPWY